MVHYCESTLQHRTPLWTVCPRQPYHPNWQLPITSTNKNIFEIIEQDVTVSGIVVACHVQILNDNAEKHELIRNFLCQILSCLRHPKRRSSAMTDDFASRQIVSNCCPRATDNDGFRVVQSRNNNREICPRKSVVIWTHMCRLRLCVSCFSCVPPCCKSCITLARTKSFAFPRRRPSKLIKSNTICADCAHMIGEELYVSSASAACRFYRELKIYLAIFFSRSCRGAEASTLISCLFFTVFRAIAHRWSDDDVDDPSFCLDLTATGAFRVRVRSERVNKARICRATSVDFWMYGTNMRECEEFARCFPPGQPVQASPPSLQAPGLDALHRLCKQIYPDQSNPLTVTAVLKYWWVRDDGDAVRQ